MIELLSSLLLTDFPSGSSINYYKDKLYLIGDDANDILVLDKDYQQLDKINVFTYPDVRIPKSVKADFETSCVVKENDTDHLLVAGSASRTNRMECILIPLEENKPFANQPRFSTIHINDFIARLKNSGEINIEGSTVIGDHLLFSNRANYSNPNNTLITTSNDFWKRQSEATIAISKLVLPEKNQIAGVSELCYVASKDVLLVSLSNEMTASAYEDGAIGDSFIGWIDSISTKLSQPEIELSTVVNLAQSNPLFIGEKIEGVCVESIDGETITAHLVSDNDQGQSKLFKVRITV